MSVPIRSIAVSHNGDHDLLPLLEREWLVTNGLGGYASGTVAGAATRRYHGYLVAALPAPLGRIMMLNHLTEQFRFANWTTVSIGGTERVGRVIERQVTSFDPLDVGQQMLDGIVAGLRAQKPAQVFLRVGKQRLVDEVDRGGGSLNVRHDGLDHAALS